MRKIKDKIIKMLGGVPRKEFAKEIEIAHKQGAACAYRTIKDFMINYKIASNNDYTSVAKTYVYVHDLYENTMQDIHKLQNS